MQTYRASVKRLGAFWATFEFVALLSCLSGSFMGAVVTFGFVTLSMTIFTVLFCVNWPTLTLADDGVRFTSVWSRRFVSWGEITSIKTHGWGPFRRVALAKGGDWPFVVPNWFSPSADQIKIEISQLWNEKKRQTPP